MSIRLQNTLNQLKVLIFAGLLVIMAEFINRRGQMDVGTAMAGMLAMILIGIVSLKIKELIPLKIPAFAWASLITLLLTTPWSPVADTLLEVTKAISVGRIGTVVLAVAGISIGSKLNRFKQLSWKVIIVAFIAFIGTFFGSALVGQFILKLQGLI